MTKSSDQFICKVVRQALDRTDRQIDQMLSVPGHSNGCLISLTGGVCLRCQLEIREEKKIFDVRFVKGNLIIMRLGYYLGFTG